MIEIINKPLLLHLIGYLYYWQMGFNSVFKGLIGNVLEKFPVILNFYKDFASGRWSYFGFADVFLY